jgi:aminopeptidase N
VAGTSFTRDEATERARLLAIDSYEVALDLTRGETVFGSTTTIRFSCTEPGASVRVDLVAAEVSAVLLNGHRVDVATAFADERLTLTGLAAENTLVVVASCAYTRSGEGMHRFVDPVDGEVYLYTQFESNDARRVYACFDQPDLKATFSFTVVGPSHWKVVSNEESTVGVDEGARGDVSTWSFGTTPRMSTYVTAFVAGPFHEVKDSYVRSDGTTIPLGLYCRTSLAEFLDPEELFDITRSGFRYFEQTFGREYPFTKYDQLGVAEFNAGAMENAGCVTFAEDYFVFRSKVTDAMRDSRANVILHEMAHMWFGDLVTMKWWDDLWLNESFAEFMAYSATVAATRFTDSWTGFATGRKAWGYRQDQLPTTHPITADAPDIETVRTNFDGITYAKGASVLRQLVAWVGEDAFFAGVRAYFDKHAWGNTTLSDLLVELEATSGRDLGEWTKAWLQTAGVNTLRPVFEVADDGGYSSFSIAQEAPEDHPTLRPHRIRVGLYDREGAELVRRDIIELDVAGESTDVPALLGVRQPDLLLLNDDDLAFAKIRLDERSLATLTTDLAALPGSLTRALCWSAAWDMTRDGELAARDFVTLVVNSLGSEDDIVTVQTVLGQVVLALDAYIDQEYAPVARQALAVRLEEIVRGAEAGGDIQLAVLRVLARVATDDAQLGLLRGLLDGSQTLPGLTVDADLRWLLLRRLVVRGVLGEADIVEEAAADNTANGARQSAWARASIPTPEAKAAAWTALVEEDSLPNALQVATIAGFAEPDTRELVRPYVEPYFAMIESVWAARSHEIASNLVQGLYPASLVEQGVVDATTEYLGSHTSPPAVTRILTEGRAGVQRALIAQAADTAAAAG